MRRVVTIGLSALIVAAIPAILVGNTLWVLINPWLVEVQYALPGFPDDPRGLRGQERTDLAITGVRAIQPYGEGVALLRAARLPDGRPAFEEREVRHMEDVRSVVAGFLVAWAVALGVALAAGLGLRRLGDTERVRRAIVRGALLTVAAIALAGAVMLVAFDTFFAGFHGIFFEGRSWRFNGSFTLRRLYPDAFWVIAGGLMAGLVFLQAGALAAGLRRAPLTRSAARGCAPRAAR